MKRSVARASLGAACGQGRPDRSRVDIAHELANVLPLARAGGAALDAAGRAHRLLEGLRQLERGELRLAQLHQLLAQILRGVRGALARALARALRERRC